MPSNSTATLEDNDEQPEQDLDHDLNSTKLAPITAADMISSATPSTPKTHIKPKVKATVDKLPTQRQLHMARAKMLRVLLPVDKEDWAQSILHAFPTFRKLALASRADIGKIKKGKRRVQIDTVLANRLYWCFH